MNNDNSWGPNCLGGTIENGCSRTVNFDYRSGTYAVAVVFMNNNWWTWVGSNAQNLNNASTLMIYYERNPDRTDNFRLCAE